MMDPFDDPDATASFRIPTSVRAPVGVEFSEDHVRGLRRSAWILQVAVFLIVADLPVEAGTWLVDAVPDLLGGVLVLVGLGPVRGVARDVGPARAATRVLALALLQLPLLALSDVRPESVAESTGHWRDVAELVQLAIALVGTAVTATVLARAHDAARQTTRRDRWMRARRTCLALGIAWVPLTLPLTLVDDPSGLLGALLGFLSVVLVAASILAFLQVARALGGTVNIGIPEA